MEIVLKNHVSDFFTKHGWTEDSVLMVRCAVTNDQNHASVLLAYIFTYLLVLAKENQPDQYLYEHQFLSFKKTIQNPDIFFFFYMSINNFKCKYHYPLHATPWPSRFSKEIN